MSSTTIASLTYITRTDLATLLRSSPTPGTLPSTLAIIDVRDSDHIGGHIRGSTWVPSSQLDVRMPELLRTLKDKELVVFHCALSQQRGPGAAVRYLRERTGKEGDGDGQKVVVLKGGFTEWQEEFGGDGGLTEGWDRGVWEWGS